ncbi:MAG TPA: IS110 family transposase, partial [Candidatus Dorea intestinavium]|nr:IS110 family transposase [Candidatus Dorea intestinavium]
MIYLGIDIAKLNHVASATNADGEVLLNNLCFTNDHLGFQKLLDSIASFSKEDLLIGLESTAHYGENLICFLFKRGYQICIINPIQTAALRKTNIRKTKTDAVDTLLIVKALIMNKYRIFSQQDLDSMQ